MRSRSLRLGLMVLSIGLVLSLVFVIRQQKKPHIDGIDTLFAAAGDYLEISGRHFGADIDGSKLFIGRQPVTSTLISDWSNTRIRFRVPRSDGAALLRVRTRLGVSNGVVLGDAARLPHVHYGPWFPGAPFVEYLDPPAGGPGILLTLRGTDFGEGRDGGEIWVNRSDSSRLLGTEEPDLSLYTKAGIVETWTDKMIQFRVPEGTATGNIYLHRGGLFSNPLPFEIHSPPGSFILGEPRIWSLRQDVHVGRIGSFPGNSLYIRVPAPLPGVGQGEAAVFNAPPSHTPMRVEGNLSLYRLKELIPGETRSVSRQLTVATRPVRTEVDAAALNPPDGENPQIAGSLTADAWIHPQQVSRRASRLVNASWNDWRKSRVLYDYVVELLEWTKSPPSREIADYLSTAQADSEGYSFLFCSLARAVDVPVRPVGGLIVDSSGDARPWWWAEVWLEGLGWAPVDPALGDQAVILPGVSGEAVEFYFGGLEGRHIAFSRGVLPSAILQPGGEIRIPGETYTLQNVWEEVSGNLESYTTQWPVPEVAAVYMP